MQQNLDAAAEARPQAAAADEAMLQAASQVPAVHDQSRSPDAGTDALLPGLGQVAGASEPDLAVKPVCDQPRAETQDDKCADLPLREDARSAPGGLSKSPAAPAGTPAIPKQRQATQLLQNFKLNKSSSSLSTFPRAQPLSPTAATNVLGSLQGSYASATPTPEPELPTTDALQKPQSIAAAPASDFSEHSELDADAHPLNTPQAAPPAAPSSMPVPNQAPVKPSDMATPSTRGPASGGEEEAAAPQTPKAPLLGLSEQVPLPPLVQSPTRLPRPAGTPEPVPSKPLPLTNPSDAAVPAPTITANVSEIQLSRQSGGQTSGQPSGQPSGQSSGHPSGQPSGQSSGQSSGAVQQVGGQAECVPNSVAVSAPPGTNASEAVVEAAGAAPAEHAESDTGECGGLGCMFYAAQNMYLQCVKNVSLCQNCVRWHRSTQCNMVHHHTRILLGFHHMGCMQITSLHKWRLPECLSANRTHI